MTEKFCLKWNDFERSISAAFKDIREEKDFFDVTLACDGADTDQLQAHKVILSACSPFFRRVLKRNPHQHPLLYLKGVTFKDLQYVLEFMYHGEVNVSQDDLNAFLAVAEELQVKGLTQNNSSSDNAAASSSKPNTNQPSNHSAAHERSSSASSRTRPSDSSVDSSAPKRFRASEANSSVPVHPMRASHSLHTQEEDDDIQEVVPVKTEHLAPQTGTMAMYGDEQGTGLDETYDDTEQDYELEGAYTEENYLVQDGSTGSRVDCPVCGKLLHPRALKRHVEDVHQAQPGKPYHCDLCGKMFGNEQYLRNHKRTTHGIYVSKY